MPERARTDLWEPRGSNPPGPPGPDLRVITRNTSKHTRYGVLASGKLGKGGRDSNSETFRWNPAGRIPPGKAGPAARSESCVVVGRPPAKRRQRVRRPCD